MLNSLLTLLAVVLLPSAFTPVPIDSVKCLSTDSVKLSLHFPGSHTSMDEFYAKLEGVIATGEGRVNVLHIGGSHVQAGDLSHTLRTRLTEMAPGLNADHGMLFPFRAIRTNGPLNYGLSYSGRWVGARNVQTLPLTDLGLTGATAITADSASHLYLDLREEGKWAFSQLHIFGEGSSESVFPIVITPKGDTIRSTQTLMKRDYSIFDLPADGLNLNGYHFVLPDTMSRCTIAFEGLGKVAAEPAKPKKKGARKPAPNYAPLDSLHHFVLRGILPQSERPGITYTESGINGASVPSWLSCNNKRFEEELGTMSPDLVVFGIGINDANMPKADFDSAAFKAQYRELIGRIRKVNPKTAFLFITNNDCWISTPRYKRRPNLNTPTIVEAFYALAEEYDGAVFDVFALMGGHKSADRWVKADRMKKDHIHFTREGYFLLGDLMYNALLRDFMEYRQSGN